MDGGYRGKDAQIHHVLTSHEVVSVVFPHSGKHVPQHLRECVGVNCNWCSVTHCNPECKPLGIVYYCLFKHHPILLVFIEVYKNIYIYIYVYIHVHTWVLRVSPPPHSVFKYSICARFRDVVHVSETLCTCQRCCARFPAVVHVSQKLCTFHKPPNNVRVQMYTHWAQSNQQKHWGDQTRSPDICIYIYTHTSIYIILCIYIYTHII